MDNYVSNYIKLIVENLKEKILKYLSFIYHLENIIIFAKRNVAFKIRQQGKSWVNSFDAVDIGMWMFF